MFKNGDKVNADLTVTAKGATVQSISSLPQPQQVGMVTEPSTRDRGPADTTCIDVCAGTGSETRAESPAKPEMPRDSASARVDVQANPEANAQIKVEEKGNPEASAQVKVEEKGNPEPVQG